MLKNRRFWLPADIKSAEQSVSGSSQCQIGVRHHPSCNRPYRLAGRCTVTIHPSSKGSVYILHIALCYATAYIRFSKNVLCWCFKCHYGVLKTCSCLYLWYNRKTHFWQTPYIPIAKARDFSTFFGNGRFCIPYWGGSEKTLWWSRETKIDPGLSNRADSRPRFLLLCFYINRHTGLEFHREMVSEDGDLVDRPSDETLVKLGDPGGLCGNEVLQFIDMLQGFDIM